ncbi:hypothetical protein [Streptomyces sp. NPDC088746]
MIPPSEGIAIVSLHEGITWEFNVVTRTSAGEATAALLGRLLAAY